MEWGRGAAATTEEPFRLRRNVRRTSRVRPIHAKAATKMSATDCAVVMTGVAGKVRGAAAEDWGMSDDQR